MTVRLRAETILLPQPLTFSPRRFFRHTPPFARAHSVLKLSDRLSSSFCSMFQALKKRNRCGADNL